MLHTDPIKCKTTGMQRFVSLLVRDTTWRPIMSCKITFPYTTKIGPAPIEGILLAIDGRLLALEDPNAEDILDKAISSGRNICTMLTREEGKKKAPVPPIPKGMKPTHPPKNQKPLSSSTKDRNRHNDDLGPMKSMNMLFTQAIFININANDIPF